MNLNSDGKIADSLADLLLRQRDDDLNNRAYLLLFRAADEYAQTSGEHEFAFLDRVMRLCAGSLVQLDAAAARAYLQALATRADPHVEPEFRDAAETMRSIAYTMLVNALRLAAAEPEGSA